MSAHFLLTGEIPEMKILEDNIPENLLNSKE